MRGSFLVSFGIADEDASAIHADAMPESFELGREPLLGSGD
jgi:hypothetical protein